MKYQDRLKYAGKKIPTKEHMFDNEKDRNVRTDQSLDNPIFTQAQMLI